MRPISLLLIPLLFCGDASAQTTSSRPSSSSSGNYNVLSVYTGLFTPNHPGHDISSSFPYTVASYVTGTRSQETFDGQLKGKFTNPMYMFGANVEFVRKHHAGDFGAGLFREDGGDHGYYLQGGYKYVLSFGGLQLKPGVELYYVRGVDRMGSIDNRDKEIYLLGYTAHDQFTIRESDGYGDGGTVENTYNAERLDVNYRRNSFLVQPKLVLATRFFGRLYLGLEFGYMVQVVQKAVIQFEQVNKHASDNYTVGHINMTQNGQLTGVTAGIRIGVCF